jgi:hypothetical protein
MSRAHLFELESQRYRRLRVATSVLSFPTISVSDRLSRAYKAEPPSAEPCCLSLDRIQLSG